MTQEQREQVTKAHDSLHAFLGKVNLDEDYVLARIIKGAAVHVTIDHDCQVGYILAAIAEHLSPGINDSNSSQGTN
jgi:hypothetical protein